MSFEQNGHITFITMVDIATKYMENVQIAMTTVQTNPISFHIDSADCLS